MTRDELINDMYAVLKLCLDAERKRRSKLKDGAPASTYTKRRIGKIEAALFQAREMGYGPGQ